MTINQLTNEIFEKSFSRDSLERLLTKEIKKKVEFALRKEQNGLVMTDNEIILETLKSE